MVSYETTLPVGTTRTRFAKALEEQSGLKAGVDFYLVFSPERVFTGRVFADLRKYPKLVGGINEESAQSGINFYNSVLDFDSREDLDRSNGVWDLGSVEAAELAKLAETTYRDVNIALANQFALYAENNRIDIHKVIEASNSQPFSHIHKPGIAVGGHCIPIYPRMYLWNDPEATVVRAAREANALMPSKVVAKLAELHGELKGQKVVVLGAAYRGGVKETAFSGVFATVKALNDLGAETYVHDPLYADDELQSFGFKPYHFGQNIDAAIVQANHLIYSEISQQDLPGIRTILDGRGVLVKNNWNKIEFHLVGNAN